MSLASFDESLARSVLDALLPANTVLCAAYHPLDDPPSWAADLVGRRTAWIVRRAPGRGRRRGADPGQWTVAPYPFRTRKDGSVRSVPLRCLREITVIASSAGESTAWHASRVALLRDPPDPILWEPR